MGARPYRDLILRDRLGHAGVKVKWEPVEDRHGVNAAVLMLRIEGLWQARGDTDA
ncbi:hypothetical protein AU162_gp113 [Pseudomonas phage YMC11/02/R656]|uniref:Uncharacterized protein n=1 Tax=Pseudomonas phage YMC11/02/R656 TaxID=1755689 RepID=A0A0S2SYA1_9CAUD|nr:hypothetical protein AU162_gp113 [Pseudomonas phage YMC11/02/R656]ALP47912.1 hypothetical protein BPPAER656_00910 [Pseudomonas phage YMC11/02/R656]